MTAALLLCLLFSVSFQAQQQSPPQSLAGFWFFELDRNDAGIREQWFSRRLQNNIRLPGLAQSPYGGNQISTTTPWVLTLYDQFWYLRDDYKEYLSPGKFKVPFLSPPARYYLGPVWYQKDIFIAQRSVARRFELTLERPHWVTTVWIDQRLIGSSASLVAPHVYDLGTLSPGPHRLTIRVDNRTILPYRPDAHSISDSVGNTWNGIVGRIELNDTGRVWIDDAQVFPDLKHKTMLIKVRVGNSTGLSGQGTVTAIWPDIAVAPVNWDEHGGSCEVEVPLREDMQAWDEFHPKLHQLRLWLKGPNADETREMMVGLRDFHAEGNQFVLNGHPINFRGTDNNGDFPLTGYPPTDVKSWVALFELCRKWGLNHVRFHSWCPPEAAFTAADQVGFYLQVEPGMWNEINPNSQMERTLYEETEKILKTYGNHPSFMLLSASNEPEGNWQASLTKWVNYFRARDTRHLYTTGTGHTERDIPNLTEGTDFLAVHRIGILMLRRESGWFGSDYRAALEGINIPVIAHDVGQWAAYPNYDVINKFKGYLRPVNYEIFRDSMEAHKLLDQNKNFSYASGRFQLECYKEEIEANLRTPGLSGFQLLGLNDYPGAGTAPVGLLDPFWESKSYATPEEFLQFCNSTVPLVRLFQRVFTTAETLHADVELAHFGAEPIADAKVVWRIEGDPPYAQGAWDVAVLQLGKNIPLGKISVDLSTLPPGEHRLTVTVAPSSFFDPVTLKINPGPDAVRGKTYFVNQWTFWVYPMNPEDLKVTAECLPSRSTNFLVTRSWEEAEKKLAAGGRVLFVPHGADLDWTSPPLDTVPIFWNRQIRPAWGRMLGLWIDLNPSESKTKALHWFPTGTTIDWRWASLLGNVRAVNVDRLTEYLEPVVSAIDDWNRNYKLGVIFECAVGDGRLLVSAIDVTRPDDKNPVARQLRYSLLNYITSDCFQPRVPAYPEDLRTLFFDTRIMKKLGATAQVSGEPANTVIDGDPGSFILAGDQSALVREPVEITITFPQPVAMSGLVVMPRQSSRDHEGDIREFAVRASDDGQEWRGVAQGELVSTFAPQRIQFGRTITAKYLKLVSLSGFGTDKSTALSEIAVIYAGPKLN